VIGETDGDELLTDGELHDELTDGELHDELTDGDETDDGVAVNDEAETDETETPDWVIDGVDDDGAGVYTVVVAPDGVV
jgi:hypothetical protein